MKRASSEPRPGSTAWTRPPAATSAATRSGIRSAASGRTDSQSPSRVTGPNPAAAARPASPRSVTRSRTPSEATTSSSDPDAMIRPWSRMTTRSHTRSTSVSRWELRMTVAPRSRAARTIARTSVRPTGSSADVGSSRRTRSGSPRSATPSPSRCCIPFENALTGSSARSTSPTRARASSMAAARLRGRDPGELGMETQDFAGMEPRLVAELLGQVADGRPRPAVAQRRAEDLARAGARSHEAEQQLDGRGLAGAVRAEQADQLAASDGQAEPVEGDGSARTTWRRPRGRSRALTR